MTTLWENLPSRRALKISLKKFKAKQKMAMTLGCIILCIIVYVATHYGHYSVVRRRYDKSFYNQPCHLPELDPFHADAMKDVKELSPINCDHIPQVVHINSNNELVFNKTALDILNIKMASVACRCSVISMRTDDSTIDFAPAKRCVPPVNITSDFFRIQCYSDGKLLMDDILTRVTAIHKPTKRPGHENAFSVLMFGLDSVSRSMAIRSIPKTFKYLNDIIGGYDMKKYMKIGDNTFPNTMALLTGKFAFSTELPAKDCVTNHCDVFPFIWQNFSRNGYATLYAEDLPVLSTFNHKKRGFHNPPADHYMRPFWRAVDQLHPQRLVSNEIKDNALLGKVASIVNIRESLDCLGNGPNHMKQINYLKQFIQTYKHSKKFAYSFLVELAHRNQNFIRTADNDFVDFFKWLKSGGFLENTVLIVFSDHGSRSAQATHILRMENSLPLLNIILPDTFKSKYPHIVRSLEINTNRLTSTFDLHATLRTLLHGNYDNPGHYKIGKDVRGISMFGEIPDQRSCADANIPDHFCVCYKAKQVNISNDSNVPNMAEALVQKLNDMQKHQVNCSVLSLHKIIEASSMTEALTLDHIVRKNFWSEETVVQQIPDDLKRYNIVIETVPGNGQFYSTVNVDKHGVTTISKDIDRINRYGSQSYCIDEHNLRPICYCKKQLN